VVNSNDLAISLTEKKGQIRRAGQEDTDGHHLSWQNTHTPRCPPHASLKRVESSALRSIGSLVERCHMAYTSYLCQAPIRKGWERDQFRNRNTLKNITKIFTLSTVRLLIWTANNYLISRIRYSWNCTALNKYLC